MHFANADVPLIGTPQFLLDLLVTDLTKTIYYNFNIVYNIFD